MSSGNTIHTITSTLRENHFNYLCKRYDLSGDAKPSLPSSDDTISTPPTGKFGLYTKLFSVSNLRIPLSTFYLDVLKYYQLHISQMSPMGAVKILGFEIACRSFNKLPTVGVFRYFFCLGAPNQGYFTIQKRDAVPKILLGIRDSLKGWKESFMWFSDVLIPIEFREVLMWKSDEVLLNDLPRLTTQEEELRVFLSENCRVFIDVFAEEVLVLLGMSQIWPKDGSVPVIFKDGEEMNIGTLLGSDSKKGVKFGIKSEDGQVSTPKTSRSQVTPSDSSLQVASRTRAGTKSLAIREPSQEQVGSYSGSYEVEEVMEKRRGKRAATGGKVKKSKKAKSGNLPQVNLSDTESDHSDNSKAEARKVGGPLSYSGAFTPFSSSKGVASLPPSSSKGLFVRNVEKGTHGSSSYSFDYSGSSSPLLVKSGIGDGNFGNFFVDLANVHCIVDEDVTDGGSLGVGGVYAPSWDVGCDSLLDNVKSRREFVMHALPPALRIQGASMSLSDVIESLDRLAVETVHCHDVAVEYLKQVTPGLKAADVFRKIDSLNLELVDLKEQVSSKEALILEKDKKIADSDHELFTLESQLDESKKKVANLEGQIAELRGKVSKYEDGMCVAESKLSAAENRMQLMKEERVDLISKVLVHYSSNLTKSYEFSSPVANLVRCAAALEVQKVLVDLHTRGDLGEVALESLPEYNPQAQADYDEAVAVCESLSFPYTQKMIDAAHLPVAELLEVFPDKAPIVPQDP